MDYPKLRSVDLFPAEVSGERVLCLRDPEQISDKVLFIPQNNAAMLLLSLMDGTHSIRDIQAEYMRRFGKLIFTAKIKEMVGKLDECLLLESERYAAYRAKVEEDFSSQPVRKAVHAGSAYEADAERLEKQLAGYFDSPEGPGSDGLHMQNQDAALVGLMAPHIDFHRGGPCYAWAYDQVARQCTGVDVFIVLGIAHAGPREFFVLTRKGFETPLGLAETNTAVVDALVAGYGCGDLLADEFLHRKEHSIELQVVMLQYALGKDRRFSIVPILCGSFDKVGATGRSPMDKEKVGEFINVLRKAIRELGKKACVIAGVDLSHVGQQFGDAGQLDMLELQRIKTYDTELLERVVSLDAEGVYQQIQVDGNRRRICGLPAIYVLLHVLEARSAKALNYMQSHNAAGGSVVTFASVGFYK
jgi:AmmeMemoRadiSam system protein B